MKSIFVETLQEGKQHEIKVGDRFIYCLAHYPYPMEGILEEISPSGGFGKIDDEWFNTSEVILCEMLPKGNSYG